MEDSNWMPVEAAEPPAMDTVEWRTQLQPDSRHLMVNKIMDTLKKHLHFSGEDGLLELKKIAMRFEEKIYATATSQSEYIGKISQAILKIDPKFQNPKPNTMPANQCGCNNGPLDPVGWRTQLPPDVRQRIVMKIMDTLRKHVPVSDEEGLLELRRIAVRFEEKIYTQATSQSDYLRKISLKMLTMETKSQNPNRN